jgi:hypothetical protein
MDWKLPWHIREPPHPMKPLSTAGSEEVDADADTDKADEEVFQQDEEELPTEGAGEGVDDLKGNFKVTNHNPNERAPRSGHHQLVLGLPLSFTFITFRTHKSQKEIS